MFLNFPSWDPVFFSDYASFNLICSNLAKPSYDQNIVAWISQLVCDKQSHCFQSQSVQEGHLLLAQYIQHPQSRRGGGKKGLMDDLCFVELDFFQFSDFWLADLLIWDFSICRLLACDQIQVTSLCNKASAPTSKALSAFTGPHSYSALHDKSCALPSEWIFYRIVLLRGSLVNSALGLPVGSSAGSRR